VRKATKVCKRKEGRKGGKGPKKLLLIIREKKREKRFSLTLD
jgi:hypothetical protein